MATDFTRPEWALEILPAGALAARRQPSSAQLQAVAFVPFAPGAVFAAFAPSVDKDAPRTLLPGIIDNAPAQQAGIVAAVRRALEETGARTGVVTLVLPDTAVRVLLLDFDSIPDKFADAIGVVRFRLRKLVPFEVDDASVSYQVLSGAGTNNIRVLAAAIPNLLLRAYEDVVRAAGFEPGVVLPSTLAALSLLQDDRPALLVHATEQYVTTAISRGNDLLLHRTHELPVAPAAVTAEESSPTAQEVREALEFLGEAPRDFDTPTGEGPTYTAAEDSEGSLFPVKVDPVADPLAATGYDAYLHSAARAAAHESEPALNPEPLNPESLNLEPVDLEPVSEADLDPLSLPPIAQSDVNSEREEELVNALTVAVAFYEDLAGRMPDPVRIAGSLDARAWQALMVRDGESDQDLTLTDLADMETVGSAIPSGISRAQLAAVCGALAG